MSTQSTSPPETAPAPATSGRRATTPLSAIPREVWIIASVIVLGGWMSQLDAAIVNVGLETTSRSLGASLATAQWIASGYLLALAAAIPVTGWAVRRFGGRNVWLSAMAGFTASSLLCALCQNVEQLIALRILQGACGGLLIPTGQVILGRAAGPSRMGRVMGVTGLLVVSAPALGPVVGGLLVETSWRWLFLINLPIGLTALTWGWFRLPRETGQNPGPLDRLGLLLATVGLPALVFTLTETARTGGGSAEVVPVGVAGVLLMVIFARRMLRSPAPLIDLRLFGNRSFAAAGTTLLFSSISMFGTLILTPLYLEIARGYSPLEAGLLMIGTGGGMLVTMPLAGRLVDRHGGGPVAIVGYSISLVSILPMALLTSSTSIVVVEVLLAINGLGFALGQLPALSSAFSAVQRDDLPHATPLVTATTRIGGALGTAIFVVILERGLNAGHAPDEAFHASFLAAAACAAVALVAAVRLRQAQRAALVTIG